ncbi:hypothetical protein M8818_003269 [Zalaria obscura]|uniref:Uncharacterized protein n=1 Tax=Zalaria obscura TaxID=2024903 RepID=A0ACC3SF88_9PEZI
MYIDVYGIPEEFLLLLSLTTGLANEKAIAQIDPSQAKLSWARFSMWTKMLEKCIMSWRPQPRDQPADRTQQVSEELLESNRRFLAHHLQALRQALIVYFHRRVHDVDPGILQDKVEKTVRHLEQCQEEDTRAGTTTATFVWPAFISACEALEPDVHERFIKWFDKSTATTGFSIFKTAKNVVQELWSHRAAVHGQPIDWLQFGRKVHLQLMVV